jgi:phosphoserine phosphatase
MLDHVLTLIAAPAAPPLAAALVEQVAGELRRLGALPGTQDWLAPERACDLPFRDLNDDQADAAARQVLGNRAVDVVAQPVPERRKRLLVADMESTLIRNEMLDELADYVGLRAEIALITARAMNGELDFEAAVEARVKLLQGLPETILDEAAARIELMPGAKALIATMRAQGATTVLVSGGFRCFTRKVAAQLGIDAEFGNELKIEAGRLTGTVVKPILGRSAKVETLIRQAAAAGLPLEAALAVGDGANDLDMILAAGLGIAFRAKPVVAARAKCRIEQEDLTALLYAQGYRQAEILPDNPKF